MNLDEAVRPEIDFDFMAFFSGHTKASGWFCDRFGRPRRHFCGDFHGAVEGNQFHLDERLYYTDGMNEERLWKVQISDNGAFTAHSDSLVGPATGQLRGNTLSMRYTMRVQVDKDSQWQLDLKDMMILQPDGSLHNIAQVYKWGVRIGTVSTQYQQHDGDLLCAAMQR